MDNCEISLRKIKTLKRKLNDGITLIMVLRGAIKLELNGQIFHMKENELAIINEGDVYSASGDGKNVLITICFSHVYLMQSAPELLRRRFRHIPEKKVDERREAAEELKHAAAKVTFMHLKKSPDYEMQMRSEIYKIFYMLCTDFSESDLKKKSAEYKDDSRLQQVLSVMHQNFRFPFSLQDAAQAVYLTPQYLSKLFKEKMGVTFLDYLNSLRLEYAGNQLLYSNLTIVRIALESGFASEKAFCERFRKEYNMTPAAYRITHRISELETDDGNIDLEEASLETLVKFLENYELQGGEKEAKIVEIDTEREITGFKIHNNIIDIGPVSLSVRADIRSQLVAAQEKLSCRYVRFHLLNQMVPLSIGDRIIPYYDYYSIFAFFRGLGLKPFIVLSVSEFLDTVHFSDFNSALMFLKDLLEKLKNRCDADYFESWCFEIVGSSRQVKQYFGCIYEMLKYVSPKCSAGLFLDPDEGEAEMKSVLEGGFEAGEVAFLTFKGDPNISRKKLQQVSFDMEKQKQYYPERILLVKKLVAEYSKKEIPVYLVEWNALTGSNVVEAGEFHRSALVADILSGLSKEAAGFSYWLNLLGPEPIIPELATYPLSLYYYQDVPRALLFLATFLNNGSQKIIYRDSEVFCMKNSGGQLIVLLSNPCYIEPFEALDNIRKSKLTREIRVVLKNMERGKYSIKRYVLDKKNGSLYQNWIDVDFTLTMYDDMTTVLKGGSSPTMSLYCQEVEGKCFIERELPMNGIAIYEINPAN